MEIIQQIAVKAAEEIFKTIQETGIGGIGKATKALVPVTSGMTLEIVTSCIEEMELSLVKAAKAQRRKDGITVKERAAARTVTTEMGDLPYRRTCFALPDGSYAYILDHLIGVEAYERFSKELIAEVLEAAAVQSCQHAIDATKQEMSRQTVHNRPVAPDDLVMPVERAEETPEALDIFSDEDHVHLTPKGSAINADREHGREQSQAASNDSSDSSCDLWHDSRSVQGKRSCCMDGAV